MLPKAHGRSSNFDKEGQEIMNTPLWRRAPVDDRRKDRCTRTSGCASSIVAGRVVGEANSRAERVHAQPDCITSRQRMGGAIAIRCLGARRTIRPLRGEGANHLQFKRTASLAFSRGRIFGSVRIASARKSASRCRTPIRRISRPRAAARHKRVRPRPRKNNLEIPPLTRLGRPASAVSRVTRLRKRQRELPAWRSPARRRSPTRNTAMPPPRRAVRPNEGSTGETAVCPRYVCRIRLPLTQKCGSRERSYLQGDQVRAAGTRRHGRLRKMRRGTCARVGVEAGYA